MTSQWHVTVSLKVNVNVPPIRNLKKKNSFFVGILKATAKKSSSGSGSISKCHGSGTLLTSLAGEGSVSIHISFNEFGRKVFVVIICRTLYYIL
jgi:hypothetical protein